MIVILLTSLLVKQFFFVVHAFIWARVFKGSLLFCLKLTVVTFGVVPSCTPLITVSLIFSHDASRLYRSSWRMTTAYRSTGDRCRPWVPQLSS